MGGESPYTLLAKRVVAQVPEGRSDELFVLFERDETVIISLVLTSHMILSSFNEIISINSILCYSRPQKCYCKYCWRFLLMHVTHGWHRSHCAVQTSLKMNTLNCSKVCILCV